MDFREIGAAPCRFARRIENLNQPIRRIFPLHRLIDLLGKKEMALVAPTLWDDPREDFGTLCMLDGFPNIRPGAQQPLEAYLAPAWAQCWSLNPGSDTLLRAYSRCRLDERNRNAERDGEGVTVTTTPAKLLDAAKTWRASGIDAHVVIGGVEYIEDDEILQRFSIACNSEHGPHYFRTVQGRAESLLWKRKYFAHEQEVRLMMIGRSPTRNGDEPTPKVRTVPIDPTSLFTSISFDPRLITFEVREREAEVRAAGYGGEIIGDTSYQKIVLQLMMTRDWPDP